MCTALELANNASDLADLGRLDEAIAKFQDVLEKAPEMVGARNNLGALLTRKGYSSDAISHLKLCVEMLPNFHQAWNNLGNAYLQSTNIEKAFGAFSRAIEESPLYLAAHSNRFLCLKYRFSNTHLLNQCIDDWRHALKAINTEMHKPAPRKKNPSLPLKVGFVSPDFRTHSVAFFFEPLLNELNKHNIQPFLYSDTSKPDTTTARIKSLTYKWQDISKSSNDSVHKAITNDKLDVAIDLCGHFSKNRLALFNKRLAPIQASWLGYPGTTHTPNIDYIISDLSITPANTEGDEEVLHIQSGAHCYMPPENSPNVSTFPELKDNRFTFGSFNNAFKISPEIAACWGKILEKSPNSRMILKARNFADLNTQKVISERMQKAGARNDQIVFLPRSATTTEHLETYKSVHLALDTFPYNGTTTTFEALWMGVPTLTQAGTTPESRSGLSILSGLELSPFITDSPLAYIQAAISLSKNPEILRKLRGILRKKMQQSKLMDAALFSKNYSDALKRIAYSK